MLSEKNQHNWIDVRVTAVLSIVDNLLLLVQGPRGYHPQLAVKHMVHCIERNRKRRA